METEHEKAQYTVGSDSPHADSGHGGMKDIVHSKGNATGEAADIYGDLATAEEFGYVERGYVSMASTFCHYYFLSLRS